MRLAVHLFDRLRQGEAAPFLEDPEFRNEVLSKIRIGRLGTVEDLMGAAVFLASDASSLMTGSSLLVDGGLTAG